MELFHRAIVGMMNIIAYCSVKLQAVVLYHLLLLTEFDDWRIGVWRCLLWGITFKI